MRLTKETILAHLQPKLPTSVQGKITAPSPTVRVLHTQNAACPGEPTENYPERYKLVGCIVCANGEDAQTVDATITGVISRVENVIHKIREAQKGNLRYGQSTTDLLSALRLQQDQAWHPGPTFSAAQAALAETKPETFTISDVTRNFADEVLAGFFRTGPYKTIQPTPEDVLYLLDTNGLNRQASDTPEHAVVLTRKPVRFLTYQEGYRAQARVVIALTPEQVTSFENIPGKKDLRPLRLRRNVNDFNTENFADVWKLAQERLSGLAGAHFEKYQNSYTAPELQFDLDEILDDVEKVFTN